MVKECCTHTKYLDKGVCKKCSVTPVPDENNCCKEIVAKGKTAYNSFVGCCLQADFKEEPNCKIDCQNDKTNPLCCPEHIKNFKTDESDYARCCALT